MTTPIYDLPELDQNQASPNAYLLHNLALRYLEAVNTTAIAVINDPPASPNDGDLYIINSAPTGVFVGKENNLAMYFGGWYFVTPSSRMAPIYVESTSSFKIYNGTSWVDTSAGITSVAVEENGTLKGSVETLNFVGSTVSVTGSEATVTSTSGTSYTDEQAQDAAASLFTGGSHTGISFSYNDASNKIDAIVTASGGGGSGNPFDSDVIFQMRPQTVPVDESLLRIRDFRIFGSVPITGNAFVFNGNSNNYLSLFSSWIPFFSFWTLEITVEVNSVSQGHDIWNNKSGTSTTNTDSVFNLFLSTGGTLRLDDGKAAFSGSTVVTSFSATVGVPFNVAVSWDGTRVYLFVNGNLLVSTVLPNFGRLGLYNYFSRTFLGGTPSSLNGKLSNIRFSRFCRYTSNYTVPSLPFSLP